MVVKISIISQKKRLHVDNFANMGLLFFVGSGWIEKKVVQTGFGKSTKQFDTIGIS